MIIELSKHKDTIARGRNGYFVPTSVNACGYKAGNCFSHPHVCIEVQSSKIGNRPPIVLRLTLDDATKLQKAIAAAVKEAK